MIHNRLFFKIYLTVLGSIGLVAILLALVTVLGKLDPNDPASDRLDRFVAAMYPATDSPIAWQQTTDRLAKGLDTDIAVFGPDGEILASSGNAITRNMINQRQTYSRRNGRILVANLAGGKQVAALAHKSFKPPRAHIINIILLIAAATGIAAYPIVRQLTRRLEEVRLGMERWGAGALDSRITVRGKDEVALVADTFNKAADRIEHLVRSQKSLLANASHELRSPLARLRMAIEIYSDTGADKVKSEIVNNLSELDELVEEILLSSRLDGAQAQAHALDQSIDLLALTAEEASLHDLEVSGQTAQVTGNAKLLRRLVRNLIQNALRHGARPVEISMEQSGNDTIRLIVRDQGKGLPPEERERVFEAFYRPAGRSEAAGGWGLGLSLVRQIAQAHGGTVGYRDASGGGAEFFVDLPHQPADHGA